MSTSRTPSLNITFPKSLPEVEIDTIEDENGFTDLEKVTLQKAWQIIKKQYRQHALNLSIEVFSNEEYLIERFRFKGKINQGAMTKHTWSIMLILERLIFEGLENSALIKPILAEVVLNHRKKNVHADDVWLFTHTIQNYVLRSLERQSSPTLVEALRKMCDIINDNHAVHTDKLPLVSRHVMDIAY